MEACPFCKAAVDEELLLYGGPCPACLNEIPGEEAPTDPGAQAKANAELEAVAAKKGSRGPLIGLLVAVVAVIGGVGFYASQPPPSEAPVELPEIVIDRDLSAHINPDTPETEPPEDEPPAERIVHAAPPTGGQVTPSIEEPVARGSLGPSGGINSFDPGVALNPLSTVGQSKILTSEAEINAMVQAALGTYTSRLQKCYNTRLNEREDLQGTWNVAFTITRQGKASRVSIGARDTSDGPLESCLTQTVQRFSFQKIAQEKPVSFPVRFGT
jgi:outer membrane biosynthesis protein TonB